MAYDRYENSRESLIMYHYDDKVLREVVAEVAEMLIEHRYDDLEKRTRGVRLSAEMIAEAISEYGKRLVPLPSEALENLDVVSVDSEQPKTWSVRVDLWTEEEGRSYLTMELTVKENPSEDTIIELDNLHVL